ncbi:MAG: GNAT family N-acetyltransferase [Deltaproteobacteria bacterium]|nr:GNAT family N-acetyltransferase [Deltaproteobacteria bacterium]
MTTAVANLRLRPYAGPDEVEGIVRIVNAGNRADGVDERWTVDGLRSWFEHPTATFDARRDAVVGELDGRMVAAGAVEWVDTRDGEFREYRFWGAVDPEVHGRGIGTALLADHEHRARELAAEQRPDRRTVLGTFVPQGRSGEALLRAAGYDVARWFFEMVRPNLDEIELSPMPDGLEVRLVAPDQHPAIWRANREAFRDHWGGADESPEAMERFLADPDTDPSLWLIAWDRDEVAGGIWNEIFPEENAELGIQRGWLGSVFTRRPWRGRGLASALIGRSLKLLRERRMTSGALGVDADNPTGALGLYEAAGFAVHDRSVAMRKGLEGVQS